MIIRFGSWHLEFTTHTHSVSASLMLVPGRFQVIFLSVSLSSPVDFGTDYHNSEIYDANMKTEGRNKQRRRR